MFAALLYIAVIMDILIFFISSDPSIFQGSDNRKKLQLSL